MDQEQYINDRLDDQINWYNKKSQENQKYFKLFRLIEIVCAALIPLFAGLMDVLPQGQIIIGVLGVIIAICAGLTALNKYQENWLTYRTTCETLKHEKYLFLTGAKPYGGDNAFNLFVETVENVLSKENTHWSRFTRDKPDSDVNK